MTHEH